MATQPSLPSTGSIVEYLKTKGQDSSFSSRKRMYSDLGLADRLGNFVGTPNQNMTLLKALQTKDVAPATPAPTPGVSSPSALGMDKPNTGSEWGISSLSGALSTLFKGLSPQGTPSTKPSPVEVMDTAAKIGDQTNRAIAGNIVPNSSVPVPVTAPASTAPAAQPTAKTAPPAATQSTAVKTDVSGNDATQSANMDSETKVKYGMSASDLYPDIFTSSTKSEADLVNEWLASSEGQNYLNDRENKDLSTAALAEGARAKLESKYASDLTALEQKLAANGLAFSGIRATQVKSLADNLAASELQVDRALASKLLDSDSKFRDAVIKGVADLVKKAADGRKEAIQQLNASGFAVVSNKLVPTVAAQNAARSQANADRAYALALSRENRLRAEGGGNKLTWSEATSRGLPLSLVGKSENDVIDSLYNADPPEWFKQKAEGEARASLTPEALRKLWSTASQTYLESANESKDHAKAAAYFKEAYGTAANPEDIKALADRTEYYVNGGLSYADAIDKVLQDIKDQNG